MAPLWVLQAKLNHARDAQLLFSRDIAERGWGLGVAAEPYKVPDKPTWFGDTGGSVAIYWRRATGYPPCQLRGRGKGFVAVDWGPVTVVGVYIRPPVAASPAGLAVVLQEVEGVVRMCSPRPVIIAGDFNAHHNNWACPPRQWDAAGREVVAWAASLGLLLINKGAQSTCVRPQGESIVDLTWATPSAAQNIREWLVDEEETLSDHRYIRWSYSSATMQVLSRPRGGSAPRPRRWALSRLDADRFREAVLAATWQEEEPGTRDPDLHKEAERLTGIVVAACDAAMPRSRPRPRRTVYWWSEAIAGLRRACITARRQCAAARISGGDVAGTQEELRQARKALRASIGEARAAAWKEMIASLERDPWGRPFKMVMSQLKPWAPPITESLEPQVLRGVVDALFPTLGGAAPPVVDVPDGDVDWNEDLEVSNREMQSAGKRLGAKNKAPGPDGIPGRCWAAALADPNLSASLRHLLSRCLETGCFPRVWRRAKLVLIPKANRAPGAPPAYRPICLLDEAGKFFERIIADRLVQHLAAEGPDLHDHQFGFRVGRSTTDAIFRVRALTRTVVEAQGGVVLAVSLDIVNAFNTLPWDQVGDALEHHGVPLYLRRVIRDYFRDRDLTYQDRGGVPRRRRICCGVPQGSVLGPLLWDLVFDRVLRTALPPGSHVVCYADDTLVLAGGQTWDEALALANVAVARIVGSIKGLGLRVAPQKTEAVFFHKKRGAPPQAQVEVDRGRVPVGAQMKYLGLLLDGRWRFDSHIRWMASRVVRVGEVLAGLMHNTGGPSWKVRRLYLNVVASVALYAAPVWAAALEVSGRRRALLNRAMRPALLRACRCYRTTSFEAAAVLAGLPPLELLAQQYARVYTRVAELQREGVLVTARDKWELSLQARARAMDRWAERISAPGLPGQWTLTAIQPCLQDWADRRGRGLTFRLVQVLTNHGCFGKYLHRIGKEPTTACSHCDGDRDTAQHTIEVCPAWADQRRVLVRKLGGNDLSLPSIVLSMLGSDDKWAAMTSFSEKVMAAKENAEWARRPYNAAGRLGRPGRGAGPRGAQPQVGVRPRDGSVPPPHGGGGVDRARVPRGAPPRRGPPGHASSPGPTPPPSPNRRGPGAGRDTSDPRNGGRARPPRARMRRGAGGGSPVWAGGTD